jgi:RimJ/RimL family protein N-acetyltransferase
METRRVLLREVREDDLTALFSWRNTRTFRSFFHHTDAPVDFAGFRDEFRWDSLVRPFQYVIEKKTNHQPIGLTFVHTYSDAARECFLNVFLDEASRRVGFGVDAFALFYRFLFERVGIERIYVDVFAANSFSLAGVRHIGLQQMDTLVARDTQTGSPNDAVRFVGDRTVLPKIYNLLEKLC